MSKNIRNNGYQRGVVLLITLIVLVVLASLGYTLTTRISAQIHRDQYIIDYQNARYACDSGLKYAMIRLDDITIKPIDRPNEPDFSDVFAFTEEQYEQFLADWVAAHPPKYEEYNQNGEVNDVNMVRDSNTMNMSQLPTDSNDPNMTNLSNQYGNDSNVADWYSDPNKKTIPGPYGPPWPQVMAPIELQVGNAKVIIEIEDENAKLPLVWGTNTDKDKQQEVDAAISTFCEWMNMGFDQVDSLKLNLKNIGEVKEYKAGTTVMTMANTGTKGPAEPNAATTAPSRRGRRRPQIAAQQQQQALQQQQQAAKAAASNSPMSDFVRLFHSSMIDSETLAQPYLQTEQRTESVLKYMSRWGAAQVNVNTAPRNVLEAAFMFGGDAPAVADAIIKARQQHPFKDVNDLQKKVYKYADSIRKSKDLITTASNVLSVKITATSGVATSTVTAAVMLDGKKANIIAIIAE